MSKTTLLESYKALVENFNTYLDDFKEKAFSEDFIHTIELFFDIAWNTIDILKEKIDSEFKQVERMCSALLVYDNAEVARTVVRSLYFSGKLENTISFIYEVIILRNTKSKSSMNNLILQLKDEIDFLGIGDFSEKDIVQGLSESDLLKHDGYSIIQTIREKPEWISEILDGVQYEIIKEELRKWGNAKLTVDVTIYYSNQLREKIHNELKDRKAKIQISDFMILFRKVKEELGLSNFPAHFESVVKPLTEFIVPQPLKMEELEDAPRQLVQDLAMKKVYVSPVALKPIDIFFVGGSGIGTSAILIRSQTGTILMDFGMSVANSSSPKWSYHRSLNFVDTILVTHSHLDHIGSLPFYYSLGYQIPWFSSKLTMEIGAKLVWNNRTLITEIKSKERVSKHEVLSRNVKKSNIGKFLSAYIPLPKRSIEIYPGIMLQSFDTAHIPGSLGFKLTIGDNSIVYTGDMNLDGSVMYKAPKIPPGDITIFDGTYYNRPTNDTTPAEKTIVETVKSTDRVIIPAFSVGRSQEVLTILQKNGLLKDRNVYVPGLAGETAKLAGIKGKYSTGKFNTDNFVSGSIVVAGGGMLQGGVARTLLDQTKDDKNTSAILCGYQAPGTLGYCLREKFSVTNKYKQRIVNARMSGHSSSEKLNEWLDSRDGEKIIVHTPVKKIKDRKDIIMPYYGYRHRIE